jgi:ElaB/YqjD/DUF883 family membrane-anchored ribosome-binding protein
MGIKDALSKGKASVLQAAEQARKAAGELVEQARPAAEEVRDAARTGAEYATGKAQEFLSTQRGKKIAAGAAAGAALGVPVPIVGPITGALVGAAVGWWVGLKDADVLAELERRCRALTPSERQKELETLEQMYAQGQLSEERYREGKKALTGQ